MAWYPQIIEYVLGPLLRLHIRKIREVLLGSSYTTIVSHLVEARRPLARIEASRVGRGRASRLSCWSNLIKILRRKRQDSLSRISSTLRMFLWEMLTGIVWKHFSVKAYWPLSWNFLQLASKSRAFSIGNSFTIIQTSSGAREIKDVDIP
jgi:hypothetical protein